MFDHCYYLDVRASDQSESRFPIEIGVAGSLSSFSFVIKPTQDWIAHWSSEAQLNSGSSLQELNTNGLSATEAAQALNDNLAGLVIFCDDQADIDMVSHLYAAAESQPTFRMELMIEGWVDDMISDYARLVAEHKAQHNTLDAKPALKGAAAMRYAHANMIPL